MRTKARTGRSRVILGWVFAIAFGLPSAAQAQQVDLQIRITQLDTSRFPRVGVHILVTDSAGQPVGVDPSSLVLLENGVPVTLETIEGMGEGEPLTTLLVLDVSGSMGHDGKLGAAQQAARSYIDEMRPGDRVGVLSFNTQVHLAQPITSDRGALRSAIDDLTAIDDTALYDAVDRAVEIVEAVQGRKAVIVLSDGMDNRSTTTATQVLDHVARAELSVSTIGFGDAALATGSMSRLNEGLLRDLADEAGGQYGFAGDPAELAALFDLYRRRLQSEYTLTYVTPQDLRDGVNRALSVRLGEVSAAVEGERRYNPGGVVPEVQQPAAWGPFALALAALTGLFFLPGLVKLAVGPSRSPKGADKGQAANSRVRIRLKEDKAPGAGHTKLCLRAPEATHGQGRRGPRTGLRGERRPSTIDRASRSGPGHAGPAPQEVDPERRCLRDGPGSLPGSPAPDPRPAGRDSGGVAGCDPDSAVCDGRHKGVQ